MKIAISSPDGKVDTQFSSRFGRCDYFVILNTETNSWETKPNPAAAARGGAGTQVVQFLSKLGVEVAISGHFGPNAASALKAAKMLAFQAQSGTPKELAARYLAGELIPHVEHS
jgi:predicted Fe-Mo cluster-binding NifX family protein